MSDFQEKSLSGHSAYCKVCWEPFYSLWVAKEDHGGVCVFGKTVAHECPNAMGRARTTAFLLSLTAPQDQP